MKKICSVYGRYQLSLLFKVVACEGLKDGTKEEIYTGWSKKMAQFLVGHDFKTSQNDSTKLHQEFSERC